MRRHLYPADWQLHSGITMEVRINGKPHLLRGLSAAQAISFSEWAAAEEMRRAQDRSRMLPHRYAEIIEAACDRIDSGEAATAAQGTLAGRTKLAQLSLEPTMDAATVAGGIFLADLMSPDFLPAVLGNQSGPASPQAAVADQELRRARIFAAMAERCGCEAGNLLGQPDAMLTEVYTAVTGLDCDVDKLRQRLRELIGSIE